MNNQMYLTLYFEKSHVPGESSLQRIIQKLILSHIWEVGSCDINRWNAIDDNKCYEAVLSQFEPENWSDNFGHKMLVNVDSRSIWVRVLPIYVSHRPLSCISEEIGSFVQCWRLPHFRFRKFVR
eukprot:Gregarina_sp_Poly_1__4600@NODE_2464_length_2093_cov_27_441264_g1559_i0_p2_GENE_NODE_2464_length_2093_cov_27_441264_g1559_i0NODE_2464_length_2093_cov_27_441264_g1559_i0_p2_ORF_typecomplete_len124_score4_52_NODE_2464_length_2093_cov_27_441264_g1559_i017212092